MKYCSECKIEISEDHNFCPKCGSTSRKVCVELHDKITLSDSITEIKKN